MIIIPEKKLTILLPWKTGSQTLRTRLGPYNKSPYPSFFHYNPQLRRVLHQHITLADYLCLPEGAQSHQLATFVRNPYDRVVSGFLQAQKDIVLQPKREIAGPAWVRQLLLEQLAENKEHLERCEYNINRWVIDLPEHLIYEIGRNTSLFLHPCNFWTHFQGKLLVEFVGKVEAFEADFSRLCQTYNLTAENSLNSNVSPNLQPSKHEAGYRYTHYLSSEAIHRINALFHDDFVAFGYPILQP